MAREDSDKEANFDLFTHDDPIMDEALEWFVQLRNTTPDPATKAEFERWIARSSSHEQQYRELESLWGAPAFQKAVNSLPRDPAFSGGSGVGIASRRAFMRVSAMAAAALIAVGIWQYPMLMMRLEADYITGTGDTSTVTLPDGSRMMMDTASAVSIDFKDGKRVIRLLQGEAFFDVRHDPAHPFQVVASYGDVVVKGTAFSVRTGKDADRIILERGLVQVRGSGNPMDTADLMPGEMIVATATSLSPVSRTDPQTALAWREGRIVFENQTFSHVLNELRRYYTGTVIVANNRLDDLVVTGNYRLDNLEVAIRTLADAAGAQTTRLPGGIIILR